MNFKLDARLESGSTYLCSIGICQVRLSNDSRYPWLILIPQVDAIFELDDLSFEQQIKVLEASNMLSGALKDCFKPDKLNVACLGNIVKQLHIHHVVRFEYDESWPGPIWGQGTSIPYSDASLDSTIAMLLDALGTKKKDK